MSSTTALVALIRTLAKVRFALLRTNARFMATACENVCATTWNLSVDGYARS
jgi:hypothetical protein